MYIHSQEFEQIVHQGMVWLNVDVLGQCELVYSTEVDNIDGVKTNLSSDIVTMYMCIIKAIIDHGVISSSAYVSVAIIILGMP